VSAGAVEFFQRRIIAETRNDMVIFFVHRLKEVIFAIDPGAFVVINNTLEVLGKRHGTRKSVLGF
jgi:hypothetical protein